MFSSHSASRFICWLKVLASQTFGNLLVYQSLVWMKGMNPPALSGCDAGRAAFTQPDKLKGPECFSMFSLQSGVWLFCFSHSGDVGVKGGGDRTSGLFQDFITGVPVVSCEIGSTFTHLNTVIFHLWCSCLYEFIPDIIVRLHSNRRHVSFWSSAFWCH